LNRKEIREPIWLGHQRSSNVKASKQVLRLQAFYGKGIENYMNDAPVNVLIVNNFSNAQTPILGKPVPILSRVASSTSTGATSGRAQSAIRGLISTTLMRS
jgi:hypothetical protein